MEDYLTDKTGKDGLKPLASLTQRERLHLELQDRCGGMSDGTPAAVAEFSPQGAGTLELYSGPNFFGEVDLTYRIIVREVNGQ